MSKEFMERMSGTLIVLFGFYIHRAVLTNPAFHEAVADAEHGSADEQNDILESSTDPDLTRVDKLLTSLLQDLSDVIEKGMAPGCLPVALHRASLYFFYVGKC